MLCEKEQRWAELVMGTSAGRTAQNTGSQRLGSAASSADTSAPFAALCALRRGTTPLNSSTLCPEACAAQFAYAVFCSMLCYRMCLRRASSWCWHCSSLLEWTRCRPNSNMWEFCTAQNSYYSPAHL